MVLVPVSWELLGTADGRLFKLNLTLVSSGNIWICSNLKAGAEEEATPPSGGGQQEVGGGGQQDSAQRDED